MAKMRHPNVVQMYGLVVDHKDHKDVVVGIVMENLSSGPLSRVLMQQVRVGASSQTSVPDGLHCRHHRCCGGVMQSLCAGPALMTSRQCLPHTPALPAVLFATPHFILQPCPPWKELLRVARDISAGMSYLHSRTGRHGKVEPDNIFVKDRDGQLHAAVGEPSIIHDPNALLDPAVGAGADRQAMGLPVLTCFWGLRLCVRILRAPFDADTFPLLSLLSLLAWTRMMCTALASRSGRLPTQARCPTLTPPGRAGPLPQTSTAQQSGRTAPLTAR